MGKTYDVINHPEHYASGGIECIDAMEMMFGKEAVYFFCICNAFKYLFRKGKKDDISQEQSKAEWYLLKAQELKKEIVQEDDSDFFDDYDDDFMPDNEY